MSAVFFGITDRLFHYERTVCRFEFSGTGINGAADLALASEGRIYVLNRGWEYRPISVRITLLTEDEDFISQFAGPGEGNGEFVWPTSIALDKSENVYVTDEWLNRVTIFDKDGNFLDKWGVAGSGDGKLNKPSGIDFDSEENLYLVDSGNGRVQKFTKDGKFLGKWGGEGSSVSLGESPSTTEVMFTWQTGATTGFRSSRRTANSWPNSVLRVMGSGSSTGPRV
jgi:hypothetical protein